jgi:hypothetical protein
MIHWPTIEAMQEKFNENLEHYVKEHPNEFVLFEGDPRNLKTTFYKTREEVDQAINAKGPFSGSNYLVKDIPSKTHRFNKGNKTKESIDEFVTVCANDPETVLFSQGIDIDWNDGNPIFSEKAICPDCGYIVVRRPTDENIRKLGEQFKKVVKV